MLQKSHFLQGVHVSTGGGTEQYTDANRPDPCQASPGENRS